MKLTEEVVLKLVKQKYKKASLYNHLILAQEIDGDSIIKHCFDIQKDHIKYTRYFPELKNMPENQMINVSYYIDNSIIELKNLLGLLPTKQEIVNYIRNYKDYNYNDKTRIYWNHNDNVGFDTLSGDIIVPMGGLIFRNLRLEGQVEYKCYELIKLLF